MVRKVTGLFLIVGVLAAAFLILQMKQGPAKKFNMEAPLPEYIGTATMKPDGAIVLRLRVGLPGGVGDGQQEYSPKHPQYASILTHIGEIKPGQTVAVRPWPDK